MAAIPVLRDRIRWCVGDGKSIKIWNDAWLPSTGTGRIISPKFALVCGEAVANLMDHDNAVWNEDLVRSLFVPFEAESILSIPISSMKPADSQIWAKTPQWLFFCQECI